MKKCGLLVLIMGTLYATSGQVLGLDLGLPPVDISGSVGVRFREVLPESGNKTFQQSITGDVAARSYIWQPWFGNWNGRLSASRDIKESSNETENVVLSGAGEVNLFHLSRFPFSAYVDIKDSRVDDSDPLDPGKEERFMRYGIRQSYRPLAGGMSVNFNLFHDEREDLQAADTEHSNRAIVSGFIHRGKHKLNASFLANDRTRSQFMDEQLDWQADVTHVYTQSSQFSLTTSAGANGSESNNDVDNVKTTQGRVGSIFHWRSVTMPLSLRGDFLMKSLKSEAEVDEERTEDEVRGSISVIYLPTDHWRLRIGAGGKSRTGSVREKSYFETISANYNSKLIPLGEFFYSYGTGLDLANETNSRTDDEQIYRANISHNLNRNWMSDWNGPLGSSLTIGQDISYEQSDIQEIIGTLVHRLTYSINATNDMRTTNLGITLYDSRNTGRNDLVSQNLNLNAIHNHRISRYSGFGLTYNINYTRQSGRTLFIDDEDDLFTDRVETEIENGKYTSLEIFYHNNRLLKVRNLRFKSRLRTSTDSLLLDHLNSTPSSEILWENRIDYTIGKLDVDFRTTWIERPAFEEGGMKTILLNIRRLF